MRIALSTLLAVVAATSCGGKKSDPAGGGEGPPAASGDTADALWALAPDKLAGGIVVTGPAIAKIDPILDQLRVLANDPELGLLGQVTGQIDAIMGKPDQHLADAGVDPKKGFAFFQTEDGALIGILPMGDRDKLVKALRGSRGATPADADTIRSVQCNVVSGAYACAEKPEYLARLGKGPGAKIIGPKLAATGARGDAEMYLANSLVKPMGFDELAVTATLGNGALDARVFLSGKPPAPLDALAAAAKTKPPGDNPAGFIAADLSPLVPILSKSLPNVPTPGGTPSALLAALKGPMTARVSADGNFDLRIALADDKPFKALIEGCGMLGLVVTLADKQEPGSCALAAKVGYPQIVGWVEGGELRISTKKGDLPPGASDVTTPLGKDLASGSWNYATWGRGSIFGASKLTLPPAESLPPEAMLAFRGLGFVSEIGLGVRVGADGVHGRLGLRTIWSNPPEIATKLAAIGTKDLFAGTAAQTAKGIAAGAGGAPFATDLAAGQGGLTAPLSLIGVMSAVAIPAYLDATKKPRVGEAQLNLNKLGKEARSKFATDGAYPKGTVAAGPTCCGQPENKCKAAWDDPTWKALDFAIDEPQHFRYGYTSTDGKTFTATAVGDLDCDGTEVTWTLTGDADSGNPIVSIKPPANPD